MSKKKTEHTSLVQSIDDGLINKVLFENWPKDVFNKIEDPTAVKHFYNGCYKSLEKLLEEKLKEFHPASWILVGYSQIELWTAVYYDKIEGNRTFAPVGRYGWRYVIERALEGLHDESWISRKNLTPSEKDKSIVFTLIAAALQVSELSNYLHFLKNRFTSAAVTFSPDMIKKFPNLSPAEMADMELIRKYLWSGRDLKKYKNFSASSNEQFLQRLNEALEQFFGFNISVIKLIIEAVTTISISLKASIIVQPYQDFIEIVAGMTNLDKALVQRVVVFTFLTTEHPSYQKRDLLRKSQPVRLINYAGLILELEGKFETIYQGKHSKSDSVVNSKYHIIISPLIFTEWLDIFPHRVAFGNRSDLKAISENINNRISELEQFFKRTLFESNVSTLLERFGFSCINLDKVSGKTISCGEIDILAYNNKNKILLVIECKMHSPIVDARYMGQVIKDHFEQQEYHRKTLDKIGWVKNNNTIVAKEFQERKNVDIAHALEIKGLFITWSSSIIKFMVTEYEVMTFDELEQKLQANEY